VCFKADRQQANGCWTKNGRRKAQKEQDIVAQKKNVNGRFAGERGTTGLAWFSSSMLL